MCQGLGRNRIDDLGSTHNQFLQCEEDKRFFAVQFPQVLLEAAFVFVPDFVDEDGQEKLV